MEKQSAWSYVSENRNLTVHGCEDLESQYYNVQQEIWFSLEVPKVRNRVFLGMFRKLQKVTISFDVLVCPRRTTRLPLDGFSSNLICEDIFFNICQENIKIWQE